MSLSVGVVESCGIEDPYYGEVRSERDGTRWKVSDVNDMRSFHRDVCVMCCITCVVLCFVPDVVFTFI